jgi:predicted transcriptional regulator
MSPTIAQRVGRSVRSVLIEQGRHQSEIANALRLTEPAVSRRCRGETAFRSDELLVIAELLAVPVQRFYESAQADLQTPSPAA